jgi:hypothetical protein
MAITFGGRPMDCKTARLLLDFARPGCAELDPTEAGDLERHLAGCPECEALFRSERQLDQHLGRAMRQVEVPERLRGQILARLDVERSDRLRRRYGHAIRALAAAAVLLVGVWGWLYWRAGQLPVVDVEQVVQAASVAPPGHAVVNRFLKSLGLEANAPDPQKVNYAFLINYSLSELPGYEGKQVPELVFMRLNSGRPAVARVFIVSSKQFNLQELLGGVQAPVGYTYKLEVVPDEGKRFAYLILYTGDNLNWLKIQEQQAI